MDKATSIVTSVWQSQPVQALLDAARRHWLPYAVALAMGYPILTRSLRYRRLNALHRKFPYRTREDMARMTDDDAFEIQKAIAQLEFPMIFVKALQFALFRTYGIPTISHLLVQTSQFSNPETSLKRYTDTSTLVAEMVGNRPTSHRAYASLARTRYLHSGYRASGKILDDDMLYTLALFALQPIRFINRFEWRQLSDLERCAIGTFWKSAGDALDVSYAKLPSGATGFKDGIQWLEELEAWSEAYEAAKMVPDVKNRETADQTTAILLYILPRPLHSLGLQAVSYVMDDRLRKAMLYDPPSPLVSTALSSILFLRKWVLRHLCLPRPYALRKAPFTEDLDENGRVFITQWDAAPYYVKPTFWNRWGPTALFTRVLGLPVPGDEGDKYYPEGYQIEDVGPTYFEGKGHKTLQKTMEEYKGYRTGKCPFH